ncbi:MAG: shikimate kinase [Bacteroidales bacterium]
MESIFMIGYMCSGKTTLGRLLARGVGAKFIDLDEYIEKKAGCKVNEIFRDKGEVVFRNLEREALHEVAAVDNCIIATGGGAPCFFDNMDFMNSHGRSVYLKSSPDALFVRLKRYKATRPLLRGKDDVGLWEFICDTLPKREIYYSRASVIFNVDPLENKEDVILAVNRLRKLL